MIRAVSWINHKIFRKKTGQQRLVEIRDKVESTVAFLHHGRVRLLVVFFWVFMNWCFMPLAFYFCFHAVGVNLPLGLLVVGFAVMFLSSNINPVPGGLGVSESLVAFTFKNLGVGFEKTLVAALLFRLAFYLIPLAISAALYLDTMLSFLKAQPDEKPS
ncbi:MAG TPA: lysylphosphatidylglycerol synthase transmembrane domain-containing protein, partial [bacterium]